MHELKSTALDVDANLLRLQVKALNEKLKEKDERIKELEKELELRTVWVKHHQRVSEIDAQKKYDSESKYQEAVKDIDWLMSTRYGLRDRDENSRFLKIKSKYGLDKQERES